MWNVKRALSPKRPNLIQFGCLYMGHPLVYQIVTFTGGIIVRQIDKAYRIRIATLVRELQGKKALTQNERRILAQVERIVLG